MALVAGTRLGAYEITGSLGAGGMGEVYRATDTKLGREVAIKTLPSALAKDTDRLARFEREAKLLAALNHAHIAAIYGLDEHEGTQYLAMELVEGETLEQKLKAGALPVEDALHLSLQIAEALEAAHERGVVHRDLKPANIMVTGDGQVKVLDFGLAKAFSGDPNEASPAHSPALSMAMTQQGLILGTAGYMSPEQASGQATDQRADVWAFGVVLYEMLTGLPLFNGESVPHILAAVLQTEPDWSRLPKHLHPRLKLLLERCLEKKVRNRYHSIADVRIEIENVLSDPQGVVVPRANAQAAMPSRSSAARIATALVVGLLVAGLSVWAVMRPATPALARFDMTPDGGLTVLGHAPSAAISRDGQSIAYLVGGNGHDGAKELRLRRLNQLGSTLTVADTGIGCPFFSPDGTQIGFETIDSGSVLLKRVSVQGGPASTITKLSGSLRGASWGADGTIIYADSASGLWRVRAAGGAPEMLTKPDASRGERNYLWPEILPGGKAVLFTIVGTSEQDSTIAVLSLTTGKQRLLLRDGVSAHYSPTGHLLFGRAGTLFAVGFDVARLQVEGDPVPIQQGVLDKGNQLGTIEASLASNGTLLYLSASQTAAARHLVWVDAEGHETPVPTPPRAYDQVVLSPDGTHAALGIEGNKSVWIADLKRGTLERLPADLGDQEPSVLFFSADGQHIASSAVRDGREAVVWQAVDGTGAAKPLVTFEASVTNVAASSLSPDGKRFVSAVNRGTLDLGVVTVGDPKSYSDFLATPAVEACAAISPDGHWIAYCSNDAGAFQVYVQRFPEGGGRLEVSINGGSFPHWSADGNALTYMRPRVAMVRVPVTGLEGPDRSPTFGAPKELFSWKYFFVPNGLSDFDMTADGKRFLTITAGPQSDKTKTNRLVLVQNWFQELKRLVPTK